MIGTGAGTTQPLLIGVPENFFQIRPFLAAFLHGVLSERQRRYGHERYYKQHTKLCHCSLLAQLGGFYYTSRPRVNKPQLVAYLRKKESGFHEGLASVFATRSTSSSRTRLKVAAACLSTG